ncbi:MAG: hypothetical protein IPP13_12130 [Kouleothrix sp.]|jgi:hypothetical protein|nr:hypothetical protein [Kouleothrix sp.]
MTSPRSALKRTFQVTIDIEATVQETPPEERCSQPAHLRYHRALVQQLQAHPAQLHHLLRAAATSAMQQATQLLVAEYGWGGVSDQQLLQPLIARLEPMAQRYFLEEVEDGANVYYFDGYDATVVHVEMTELE